MELSTTDMKYVVPQVFDYKNADYILMRYELDKIKVDELCHIHQMFQEQFPNSKVIGLPNEVKLKYLADNDFAQLKGEELKAAMKDFIAHKNSDLKGQMVSQGTTPRKITDLIGSLCDLTSGSGDKGTPVIFIQGYFDTYADE